MKRILSISGILALVIFFTSAISIGESPQDLPRTKKEKKHIKMVKVGDDGKKVEIDTVIEGDNIFVFDGDTISGHKEMKWISKEDFEGSMDFDFDIDVEKHGKGNVIIMRSGKEGEEMVREFIVDGDCEGDIMKWHSKSGNDMFFGAPHAPKVIRIEKHGGNVIDLSDPGIISFEKKELKEGKEKIIIIRNKPSAEDIEIHEEIIMHGAGAHPMFIHEGHGDGVKSKQIKVIAGDEGNVQIFEDGKLWSVDEMEEGTKVIEKDGKKIIIKKIKEGNQVKVNVEVEEELHEEKEHE